MIINRLSLHDTVVVFINQYYKKNNLNNAVFNQLKNFTGKTEIKKFHSPDKNALDFQLCTYLGYMAGKFEYGQRFYIVSKDKGYRSAIDMAKSLVPGIEVEQISGFNDIKNAEDLRKRVSEVLCRKYNSRKVISRTCEVMTQAENLKDLHDYLSHQLTKDGEDIYTLVKPLYLELHPDISEKIKSRENAEIRKEDEKNKNRMLSEMTKGKVLV